MKRFAGLPRRVWVVSVTLHLIAAAGLYLLLPRLPAARPLAVESVAEPFDLSLALPSDAPPAGRIPFPVPPSPPTAPQPPVPPVPMSPAEPGRLPTITHVPSAVPGELRGLLRDLAARPAPVASPTDLNIPSIPSQGLHSDIRPVEHSTSPPPGAVAPNEPAITDKFAGGKPIHGPLPDTVVVVYLLDCSTSVGLDRDTFDAARAALLATVAGQKSGAKFQVMTYQTTTEVLLPRSRGRLLTANEETLREIADAVGDLKTEGGSRHDKAVRAAVDLGADYVILISDATDAELKVIHRALNAATKRVALYFARAANGKVAEPVALGK